MARPVRIGQTSVSDPEAISTDDKMASTEISDRKLTRKVCKLMQCVMKATFINRAT